METEVIQTNLDRLNHLLRHEDIPSFRKNVGASLNNIKWLKGVLLRKENIDPELRVLLQLDPKTLHKPYAPQVRTT